MTVTLWPRRAKHDPDTVISRLRQDVASLLNRQAAADEYFTLLTADRNDVYAAWQEAIHQRDEASIVAACMQSEYDLLAAEVTALKAQLANATAISAPAGRRDVDPDDQPTQPIPVRTLWDAHGIGPVTAVTDPGTWGARREGAVA